MMRECLAKDDFGMIKQAWQGGLFEIHHKLIFNFKGKPQYKYVPLHPIKDSSVIVWPVTITTLPRAPTVQIAKVDLDITEPRVVLVPDLDMVEAWTYNCFSFMGLRFADPSARAFMKPGQFYCLLLLLLMLLN